MSIREQQPWYGGRQSGDLPSEARQQRKAARRRDPHSGEAPRKHHKPGEEEVAEEENKGLGAVGARAAHCTIRVTDEGCSGFDVLHGVPPDRKRHRKRDAKRRLTTTTW